jgi:glycosyltransferase involved in cell wall biosynthesis
VIALGVDNDDSHSATLAEHFPSLNGEPYVLVMSRLHPKKGLEVLLDAFVLLASRLEGWRLVIAGDGPTEYVLKLKNKAALSSQRERIVFTGWLEGEKKAAVLGNASLLILPSYQENFGLCVMEAMSNSVPVLVSPNVNLAPEIDTAGAGWISEVEKNALASRLVQALSDHGELERRARAAKELSRKYSWEATATGLTKLYEEILAQSSKAAKVDFRQPQV